jgi:hypothetical protein
LSGSAIVGATFKFLDGGLIRADDTLNLFNILVLTAPLTFAAALIFGAEMKGAFAGSFGSCCPTGHRGSRLRLTD